VVTALARPFHALFSVYDKTGLAEFAAKTEPDKMVDILRKSWKKMSPRKA